MVLAVIFLSKTPKAKAVKAKIYKQDYVKPKSSAQQMKQPRKGKGSLSIIELFS